MKPDALQNHCYYCVTVKHNKYSHKKDQWQQCPISNHLIVFRGCPDPKSVDSFPRVVSECSSCTVYYSLFAYSVARYSWECVIITTHHRQIAPQLYCPEEAQDVVVKVTLCSLVEVPHFVAVILWHMRTNWALVAHTNGPSYSTAALDKLPLLLLLLQIIAVESVGKKEITIREKRNCRCSKNNFIPDPCDYRPDTVVRLLKQRWPG